MSQKPEIQYVGQFYVYGSEAREAARKAQKEKNKLPKPKLIKVQKIYIDPMALLGIATAIVLLVVMTMGAVRLRDTRDEYERVTEYLAEVKRQSAMVEHAYHVSYDEEKIRDAAIAMGMIPVEEARVMYVRVTPPVPEEEPSVWEDIWWFLRGLVAEES